MILKSLVTKLPFTVKWKNSRKNVLTTKEYDCITDQLALINAELSEIKDLLVFKQVSISTTSKPISAMKFISTSSMRKQLEGLDRDKNKGSMVG